jgi:hypothetical protein
MKKILSISFAILILLSGMHLSIATHICGGEVAAVKLSFSGQIASCGMEESLGSCASNSSVSSNCCQNQVSVYAVDSSYSPSTFHLDIAKQLLQVFSIPVSYTSCTLKASTQPTTSVEPPGKLLTTMVSLSDICVFRI